MEEARKVGKAIGDYLKKNGIRQNFVAEWAGIREDSFSRAVKGQRVLNCVEFYKICKVLDVPMETFIEKR